MVLFYDDTRLPDEQECAKKMRARLDCVNGFYASFECQIGVTNQKRIFMYDYNHKCQRDGLGKFPLVKYAKLNSFRPSPRRIKNNIFIKIFEN